MKNEISLINLGKFADTATTLVNRVSDAVGGVFRPGQIKRIADAEAYATKVRTRAQTEATIEATELEQRALSRMITEESERQKNIESVTIKALPLLTQEASPEKIEKDWLVAFFDKARLISNDQMQELWSRVLAGEANYPGSYSKRTIQLLATLDKSDADMFSSLCNFIWDVNGPAPLVFDSKEKLYNDNGVDFGTLLHLDSIGLIKFDGAFGFKNVSTEEQCDVSYLGNKFELKLSKANKNVNEFRLPIGNCLFTSAGLELSEMCPPVLIDGYLDYVLKKWTESGIKYVTK